MPKAKTNQQREEDGSRSRDVGVIILLLEIPACPIRLSTEGRDLWENTCDQMIKMRTLTSASLIAVEQLVMLELLARKTFDDPKIRVSQRLNILREARLAAEDLGLSPSAHARVKRPEGAVQDNERERSAAELIDR